MECGPLRSHLSRNLKWGTSPHLSKSGSAASWWGHRTPTQLGGTYSKPKKAGPVCASAAGLRPGLFCWLCAARRARVIGRLSAAASRPRPRPTRAWGAASGGLGAALAPCAWGLLLVMAAARPGPVPQLGVRSLVLPGFVCPPGPGLWRSFRAGQRLGCPPWFMPWLCRLPGWFFWLRALPSFGFPGPLPRPAPLLRSSGFSRRAFGRQVGAGAQARKGGWCRSPTEQAAL